MGDSGFNSFDPANPSSTNGENLITPSEPDKVFKEVGEKAYTQNDMLEILRSELRMPEKIAWIEEAFSEPPASGVTHRYYLDVTKQVYLVRHHPTEGKALFIAETDEKALEELPPERNPFSGMH